MKKLYVAKSKINGTGLFSSQQYRKGDFIEYIHGEKVLIKNFNRKISERTVNWIGASRYTWINTDNSNFRFINHSCEPNVAIKGERTVYALRHIHIGEEILMDYSLTECEEGWSIVNCNCGSKTCRKKIGPITSLNIETFKKLKPLIPIKFQLAYKSMLSQKLLNR